MKKKKANKPKRLMKRKRPKKCKGCGFEIHESCDYCGECLCEEDGL